MNIIEYFKEDDIYIALIYYGINNMVSNYQVKALIEAGDKIINYFEEREKSIKSLDDYIDYLFIETYSKLGGNIKDLKEQYISDVTQKIRKIEEIKKEYKISEKNKYIKENYEKIFSEIELEKNKLRKHEIIDNTIDYIIENYQTFKTCKNLYSYIIEKFPNKVLYRFDEFKVVFDKYRDLLHLLFEEEVLKAQLYADKKDLTKVLKYTKKEEKELYEQAIEKIYTYEKKQWFNTNEEKVMQSYNQIKETIEIFKELREAEKYKEYRIELKEQENILNNSLRNNGIEHKYSFSLEEIIKVYEDKTIPWEAKSLMLTHTKKDGKFESLFSKIIKEKEIGLMDLVSSNADQNSYFTRSIKEKMEIALLITKHIISYLIQDDNNFKEFINYIYAGIRIYTEKNDIKIDSLEDDMNMLAFSINELIIAQKERSNDEVYIRYRNYNTIHLILGIFEKVLREIIGSTILLKKSIMEYNLTIENILNHEDTKEFLGEENAKTFLYFFSKCDGIGKNIRNDISHYNNNVKEIANYDTTVTVLYLLLLLSNELLTRIVK